MSAAINPLGTSVAYLDRYDPTVLFPVPRERYRAQAPKRADDAPLYGVDIWGCYELSWLNSKGVPQVGIGELTVPADSVSIVESKSLKLYLGGFAQERFDDSAALSRAITSDLQSVLGSNLATFSISPVDSGGYLGCISPAPGVCIDDRAEQCTEFNYSPAQLSQPRTITENSELIIVHSNLFRSLCPVTSQPDFATVTIAAVGGQWNYDSLLRYLVSFRKHSGFHELCCETVFADLWNFCHPIKLCVECRFTRRGGIEINPLRTSDHEFMPFPSRRLSRQ